MYTIITSFNEKYWNEVAKENMHYLDRHWPSGNKIVLYHEMKNIDTSFSNRVQWIDLYQSCPEIKIFGEKWKDDPHANGNGGTNFRLNAVKFVHKTFAIWHQAKQLNSGWLIWMDCDACVHRPIDEAFIKNVLDKNKIISYVGRPGKYSECGFLAFNLDNPLTRDFLNQWEDLYVSGEFIKLPETHDSWTFDYIRLAWNKPELFLNLNEGTITNKNPFSHSKIGPYIAHAKGDNKGEKLQRIKKNARL